MRLEVGSKVKFAKEKQRFTVQASDERFAVCTKPLNMIRRHRSGYEHRQTVIYTIVDFDQNRRGPDNLIFGFSDGYDTRQDCEAALTALRSNEMEVSGRRDVPLDIESVDAA